MAARERIRVIVGRGKLLGVMAWEFPGRKEVWFGGLEIESRVENRNGGGREVSISFIYICTDWCVCEWGFFLFGCG